MSIIVPLIWMLRESLIIVATNNEINKLHEAVYRKQKQVLMELCLTIVIVPYDNLNINSKEAQKFIKILWISHLEFFAT